MNAPAEAVLSRSPVSEAVLERARAAVREYYASCFWFWKPEPILRTAEDVELVIDHLRTYGDKQAWRIAQELRKCL